MIMNQVPSLLHSYSLLSVARLQSKVISHNSARVLKVKSSLAFRDERRPELPALRLKRLRPWEKNSKNQSKPWNNEPRKTM